MATYLGSLVQFCCGEGGTLQQNTPGICGECSQWMDHTGFATAQGNVCFPSLHCSGCRVLCKGAVPSGPCISCTSWTVTQVLGCSIRTQTQMGCAFCALPRSGNLHFWRASLVSQLVNNLLAMQETQVRLLRWEDPLEKEMATHSNILP